jgi:hypothetical protein
MPPRRSTLSENIRTQPVELQNKHLQAAIDRHAQVKQAHWDARGPGLIAIHELLDKVAAKVENYSDPIAESAGGLGDTTHGTITSRGGTLVRRRRSSRHRPRASADSRRFRNAGRDRPIGTGGHRSSEHFRRCRYRQPVHGHLTRRRPAALVRRISYCSKTNKIPRYRVPPQNDRDGSAGPCDSASFGSSFYIGQCMPHCVGARDRLDIWVNRGGSGGEVSG